MSERKETCGNCRYYDQWHEECRKNPPVIVDWIVSDTGDLDEATKWPKTCVNDWCGGWFKGANGG